MCGVASFAAKPTTERHSAPRNLKTRDVRSAHANPSPHKGEPSEKKNERETSPVHRDNKASKDAAHWKAAAAASEASAGAGKQQLELGTGSGHSPNRAFSAGLSDTKKRTAFPSGSDTLRTLGPKRRMGHTAPEESAAGACLPSRGLHMNDMQMDHGR